MIQRAVYFFNCCDEGRCTTGRGIGPHYFLILSGTDYNNTSKEYVTAIPFTSKINKLSTSWYQVQVKEEDLEAWDRGSNFLSETTYVLADRPCRIQKKDIRHTSVAAKIKYDRYKEIITYISKFMREAN